MSEAKTQITLAEALLERKRLNEKVDQLRRIQNEAVLQMVVNRQKVSDDLDEVKAMVPRVTMGQVTGAFDHYAKALRSVDAVIQRANWETDVEVPSAALGDYEEPEGLMDPKKNPLRVRSR